MNDSENQLAVRPGRQELPAPVENIPRAMFYLEPAEAHASPSAPDTVMRYLHLLQRHKLLLAGFALLSVVASLVVTGLQSPSYRASTMLEILSLPDGSNGFEVTGNSSPQFDANSYVQTQLSVLRSRTLRQQVLDRLEEQDRHQRIPGKQWESWAALLGLRRTDAAAAAISKNPLPVKIEVSSPPNTRLMQLSVEAANPDYAARFTNKLVEQYMEAELAARWDSAQRSTDWLTRQLRELKIKMTNAENALRQHDQSQGLLLGSDKRDTGETQLSQMLTSLMTARADRIAKQSLYEQSKRGGPGTENPRVSAYRLRLTDLRQSLAELKAQFTSEYPKVKNLQAQVNEVESALERELESGASAMRAEYEAAARREELLEASYNDQRALANEKSAAMMQHETLQHDVDSLHQLYDELYRKVREGGIASASKISSVRVVDAAVRPRSPVSPRPVRNAALGLTAGLFLGIVFVVSRDWIKQSFNSPGETPLYLGVPELGIIPDAAGIPAGLSVTPASALVSKEVLADMLDPRFSAMTESFRNVVTAILAMRHHGKRQQVILATSPNQGDGKSTAASILAASLAEVSRNVVLIDGDLRKPTLHKLFGVGNEWGLSDVLQNSGVRDIPIHQLLKPTNVVGLQLLTSGPMTPNITSLLYSHKMRDLLDRLREHCDTIVIDAPPLLAVSDARILGQYADGAVMMIRASKTTRDEAAASAEMLRQSGIPLIGTILNRADRRSAAAYGAYSNYGVYGKG